jgi:hypothetical protein
MTLTTERAAAFPSGPAGNLAMQVADVRLDDVRSAVLKRAKHLMIDTMAAWIAINMRYVAEKTRS